MILIVIMLLLCSISQSLGTEAEGGWRKGMVELTGFTAVFKDHCVDGHKRLVVNHNIHFILYNILCRNIYS